MVKRLLLSAVLFFFMSSSVIAQGRYAVAYGGFAGFQATIWAMKDLGLLDKHGLNADLVMIPGSARGLQALLAGSVHFAQVDATAPISAALKGGEVVIIGGSLNKIPFSMVTQPEIREPAQLKGKKIGIINFGGANELSIILALNEWNIPIQSVTLFPSGPAANRLVALSAKALDATVLSPPETIQAAKIGFRVMVHLSDLKASFPMNTIAVQRSFLENNREVVKRFLRAHSEAIYQFMNEKKKALAVYQQRLKQKDPDVIEETFSYYAPRFSFPPRVDRQGLGLTADFVIDRVAKGKGTVDLRKVLDESILDELTREGFFKEIAKR